MSAAAAALVGGVVELGAALGVDMVAEGGPSLLADLDQPAGPSSGDVAVHTVGRAIGRPI